MTSEAGKALPQRAKELAAGGGDLLGLPTPEQLGAMPEQERFVLRDELRVELYALSSVFAERVIERSRRRREERPPYGLVRSLYSQLRMMSANPEPFEEGSIDSFYELGRALIDTMVFDLHQHFGEQRHSDDAWMIAYLEHLLSLFRVDAGPATRSRMRDPLSFLYGGLHFGTGVSVQFAEAMNAVLDASSDRLTAAQKAPVLKRSSAPAFWLASLNVDHVIPAHQGLQSGAQRPGETTTWMDPGHFVIRSGEDGPWRVELRSADGPPGGTTTWTTLGCPARVSPAGGASAIATLWTWTVELAHDTGLLGPIEGYGGGPAAE